MPTTVFLNGAFVEPGDARVSAFDAGLQHAVGLFETLTAGNTGGEAWGHRLPEHVDRLCVSAKELALSNDLRRDALIDAVLLTVKRSGLPRARVRLTITAGDMSTAPRPAPGTTTPPPHAPTVMVLAQPATNYPESMYERGTRVVIADARANPFNPFEGHKTLNYWWRLRELHLASAKGAAEALVFQITNHLAGGCVSNVFVVKDAALLTPYARGDEGSSLPSPVLPGITRAALLDMAAELGIQAQRRMITIDDLLGAEEIFLTNSSWGVLPVVAVERETIGAGSPGPVTRRLRELVEREMSAPGGSDGARAAR
ncbi:MAG: aminotransferase class IV family protein [Phycisphaeraceae bacterium]|nr:aminotransferase class IV family protein [Phycisphaeraceae bacterium]